MTLGEKQRLFARLVASLILRAYSDGYELSFGEAWRPPGQAVKNAAEGIGIVNSLHGKRLAIDINLFRGGHFLSMSEDHQFLGDFWKGLDPLCRWGGDFSKPDGNHYSIEHEGVK